MKTIGKKQKMLDFLKSNHACKEVYDWVVEHCTSLPDMWDKLCKKEDNKDWLFWVVTQKDVFTDQQLRQFACWCVRNTPLAEGGMIWDLLTDNHSRNAVVVAERYASGEATDDELFAAWSAANAARDAVRDAAAWSAAAWSAANAAWSAAAWSAANAARDAAAWSAARDAAWDAARDAARDAQILHISGWDNPFLSNN